MRVCFKETIVIEVREWIKKNHSSNFRVKNKENYATYLQKISHEEENHCKDSSDCTIDRIKIVLINQKAEK